MSEALLTNTSFGSSNSASDIPPLITTIPQITYNNNYDGYTTKSLTIKKSVSYEYIAMYIHIPSVQTTINITSGVSLTIYYKYSIDSYETPINITNLSTGMNYLNTPEFKYKATVFNSRPINQVTSVNITLTIGCTNGYSGIVTIPPITITSTFI